MAKLGDLATELLIEIFSNLDYKTLKLNISHTCRRFRAIIKQDHPGIIAETLFRREVKGVKRTYSDEEKWKHFSEELCVQLNPCIQWLTLKYRIVQQPGSTAEFEIEDVGFFSPNTNGFTSLTETDFGEERAFSAEGESIFCVSSTTAILQQRRRSTPFAMLRSPSENLDVTVKDFAATLMEFRKLRDGAGRWMEKMKNVYGNSSGLARILRLYHEKCGIVRYQDLGSPGCALTESVSFRGRGSPGTIEVIFSIRVF